MSNPFQDRKQLLIYCNELAEDIQNRGLKHWGPALGASDAILEDVMLLEEIRVTLTTEQWKALIQKEMKP